MALIKLGPLVAGIRGSVGGVVFGRGYGGNYARNRTKPVYPGSSKQSARAALMSTLVGNWQATLTNAQRVAWNNLASSTQLRNRLGENFSPSGFNLYARANFLLDLTGQSLITVAPAAAVTPSFPPTLDYAEATGVRVTAIDEFDTSLTGKLMFQYSLNKPQSRFFFKGPWDDLVSLAYTLFDALPYTLLSESAIDQGKRNWFRFTSVLADGAISAETIYSVDRAAA